MDKTGAGKVGADRVGAETILLFFLVLAVFGFSSDIVPD